MPWVLIKHPFVSSAIWSIYIVQATGFSVARVGLVDEQQHSNVNLQQSICLDQVHCVVNGASVFMFIS